MENGKWKTESGKLKNEHFPFSALSAEFITKNEY
jgi:hypothetical protein